MKMYGKVNIWKDIFKKNYLKKWKDTELELQQNLGKLETGPRQNWAVPQHLPSGFLKHRKKKHMKNNNIF